MPPENTSVPAPDRISINGALAFAAGDPVPRRHAEQLGLTGPNPRQGPISATADAAGVITVDGEADAGPPPVSASKAAWVDYAVAQGLDRDAAEAATKAELVESYGSDGEVSSS